MTKKKEDAFPFDHKHRYNIHRSSVCDVYTVLCCAMVFVNNQRMFRISIEWNELLTCRNKFERNSRHIRNLAGYSMFIVILCQTKRNDKIHSQINYLINLIIGICKRLNLAEYFHFQPKFFSFFLLPQSESRLLSKPFGNLSSGSVEISSPNGAKSKNITGDFMFGSKWNLWSMHQQQQQQHSIYVFRKEKKNKQFHIFEQIDFLTYFVAAFYLRYWIYFGAKVANSLIITMR